MSDPQELINCAEKVARELLGKPNSHSTKTEICWGSNDSTKLKIADGTWYSHEEKRGGGVLDLVMWRVKHLRNKAEAAAWLREHGHLPDRSYTNGHDHAKPKAAAGRKEIEAFYSYTDEAGVELFQTVRFVFRLPDGTLEQTKDGKPSKTFGQRHRDPATGDWVWNVRGIKQVPYRLPALLDAIVDCREIFVIEGEKKVEALRAAGFAATCNAMGSGKFPQELVSHFQGADVVILPDNDAPGRKHADLIARRIESTAMAIRVLNLPGLPPKGDVIDWLAAGGTADELAALAADAPDWVAAPLVPGDDSGEPPSDRVATADGFLAFWHGEVELSTSQPWTVQGTIPEVGAGLLAGQWGTYKTFAAIDLGVAVISGTKIFNSEIVRQGGVLLFAAEGGNEVATRLQASIDNRCPKTSEKTADDRLPSLSERAPFTWLTPEKIVLNLLDPKSVAAFIARALQISEEMLRRFSRPLVLIEVDTVVATAGYMKSGDEDDAVLGARVMKSLGQIARKTKTFVLGVDHFGKSADNGPRGSSAKEDNSDVVLVTLGTKSISGVVTNPRLAVRKVRGGVAGREYPFTTRLVDIGVFDANQNLIKTLVLDWSSQATTPIAKEGNSDPWGSNALRILRRIMMSVIADLGSDQLPYLDGPVVRAVDLQVVRNEFFKEYHSDAETKEKKQDARRAAFNRAVGDAQKRGLIAIREIGDIQYAWFAKMEGGSSDAG